MNVKFENKKKQKIFDNSAETTPHYGVRKLSAGVASVLLSTTLWMGKSADAHAATETANTKNAVNDNESDSTVTTDSGLVVDSAASSATAQNSQSEQKEDNDSVDTDTLSASEKSTQNSVSKAADDAAKQSNVSENSKETDSSSDANNASDTENSNSEVSSNTDKTAASSDSETAENSKMDDTKADSAVNKSDNNSAITESTSKANAEKESTTDSTSDTSAVSLSKDNDTGATSVTIVKNSSSSTTNTVSIKKLTATTLASLSSNSATFNPRMMFTSLAAVTSSNIHGTHAQRSSDDVPYFYDKYNDTDGNATLQGTFTPTSSTTGSYEGYYHATYLNYVNLVLKITFNYAYNESNNTMSVTNMTLGYSKDPTVQGVGFNDAMAILTGNAGLPTAYAAAFPFEQGDLDGVTPESLTNAIYSSAGADQVLGLFVQNNKTDDSSWKTQIHDYTVTPDANGNFKLFQLAGRWYGNADYYGYDGSVWDYIQVNSGSVKADTIKETVKYVVSDGKVAAPSDNVQTVRIIKIGENGKTDTKTFNAVNTPAIAGYTADISVVPSKNVNYGDSDIVVTVTYTPDAQKATVTYIDDNTGSTITSKSLTGVSNAGTGYTTAATIASLQAQGYILVSDSTNGVEVVFDNNDAVDQSYVVHLKHGTNAGSLQRTVNRTITYKMTDGSAAPAQVKDRLVFNGKEVIDNVTKAVIGITWDNAKNFNDISSPVIQGYTADRKLVSNKGISHDSPDINEVVTYSPDAQKATVSYIDDNTGKTITSKDLTGSSNAKSGYTTASTIASLQAQGYVLVSDSTNGAEIVFDNNTSVDQSYVVHLKHGTSQRAVSNTVNRTINYKATDGATVPMPVKKDSLTFNGTETIDNVTGKVTGTVWDGNKDFADVATPAMAGYTASQNLVSNKGISHNSNDIVENIVYTPDSQKANVTYIDDTTGSTISSKDLMGPTNSKSGYTTASTIASLQAQGYVLVSDSTNGAEIVFDNNDSVDQNYVVHLKHGTHTNAISDTVNRTITYKMKDGSTAPAQVKDSLAFNGTQTIDNVTKVVINTVWDANKDFADKTSPAVKGYTSDRSVVSNKNISHDSADITEVVTYSPDPQKATVTYIDQTTGKQLKLDSLNGVTNAHSGYTTGGKIAQYTASGYALVSDSTNGAEIIYDNDDAVDQAYTVILKHTYMPVTPTTPGIPGTPMPGTTTPYPPETDKGSLEDTVNRTITYKMTDGSTAPAQVKDSLYYSATKIIDKVTGEITSVTWTPNQDFKSVASPNVKGYTPDRVIVTNTNINHASADITENVTYNPDPQKAKVTYIDQTTGKQLTIDTLQGVTNAKSGYTTANKIKQYEANGYALVSDSTNGTEIIYDNDDSVDQAYEVILKHTYLPVDPTKPGTPGTPMPGTTTPYPPETDKGSLEHTVNRTITYKMRDGSTAPAAVKDSLYYSATKIIDKVTGEITSVTWTPNQDFADKTTPAVKGYTPDRSLVSNKNISHTSADITETVTYNPDPQKATVKYIDQTTGKQLRLDSLEGVTNAHSGYTTAEKIKLYTARGYALVSDSTNGAEIIYDNEDAIDQAYTVILKHTYMTVDPKNPGNPGNPMPGTTTLFPPDTDKNNLEHTVNRTITYKMKDGSTAPAQVKDSLYYSAVKTIDKVTGEITAIVWTPNQDFKDIASPGVKGYTPDRSLVSNKNVGHNSADITENVTYTPDPQKATVTYVDQTTGKQLILDTLEGVTNAKSGYTTAGKIKQFEAGGYALVSDSTNGAEIIYDNDDAVDQAYTVILKHTYMTVDPTKPGTPGSSMPGTTTNYPNGTDKASLENTVHRTITYVMKDGSTAPAQVKDSLYYSAVKTIDKVTGEITSVIWTPNQDFKDITSPAVKGYTPDRSLVSNKNIGHTSADITEMVTYAPDAQKATVTYIDQTTGKQLTLDTLEGVTNAHSGYTTESKIKQYEAGGYALVSDSTNGAEIIYDNDDAVNQAYTVILKHTYTTVDPINPGTPGTPMPGTTTVYPPETDRDNLQRTVFRQIDYQMADGKHLEPDSVSDSLYFSATKTIDKVTGEITNTTWTPAQDFKDVESPAIKGYTPDKKLISNKGITHLSYNIHEVVTYNPDKQRATVEYIDQTTGKQLAFDQLVGVTNGESDYSTESKINSFKRSGYALVSDSTGGYGIIFDDDDDVDQAYTVILKHTYITVDPKNPGTPGSSMPGTTTVYPEGSDKASLEHTVNRTITYKMADGSTAPAQVKDSLYYSAAKTIDKVTGEVVKTVWTPAQDFKDITSPAVKGYTPDRASVSNKGITHDMADITESVTYTPDKQKATVTYIDQTTGKQLTIDSLIGVTNAKSGYTTAGKIKQYVASGYALVSDSTNGKEIIYDNDDAVDQAYTVILKHTYTTVDPKNPGTPGQTIPGTDAKYPDGTDKASLEHTVNRTITYVMKDGSKAPSQVKDSLYYAATKTIDKVTGLVTETVWTPAQDFKDIATPAVKGYTPDRTSVSNKGIAHDHADIAETVNYTPDKQSAKIIYIDQTTGEQLRLDTINGVTNAHSGYTTKDKIQEYLNNGYELVSDTTNGSEIVYDNDDAVDQSFTVTLKHTYQTVTEDNPAKPGYPINQNANGVRYPEGTDKASLGHDVTRTIIYKMADGTKAPEQVKETLHYSAVKVIDKVTGKIVSEKWTDNQDFKDVTSPDVSGYTVDRKVVSNKNIAHTSDDIVETVTYSPDWQKATVTYLDETTGKTLKTDDLNGLANAKSGYSTKDTIQGYLDNGYELVSDSTNGLEIVYDADDAKDQAYTVVLKHKFTTVDEDHPAVPGTAINKNADGAKYPEGTDKASLGHDVKRDITYCMSDGSKAPSPIESVLHFTAKKVIDNVTGEVVSTDWSSAQDFDDVTSPSIAGYTADQKVVSNKGITHDRSDIHVVVTYVANAQKATVTYIDATTGKTIAVKELSGKSNAHSGYTTGEEIQVLKNKGYALVSDDTKGQEIVFDSDDALEQTYVVKMAHLIKDSTETHEATRTINLHEPSGVKSIKQVAKIERAVKTDAVTGDKTYGDWSEDSWKLFNVPKVKGCTSSLDKVLEKLVTDSTKDETVDIYYKKNPEAKLPEKKPETPKAAKEKQSELEAQTVPAQTAEVPQLPATGNSKDNAILAAGTFAAGTSLLATVLKRRMRGSKKQHSKE